MYDVQMYDVRGGQSSIQEKHTREDVLFHPSYINLTSYIFPSYIFWRFFAFYLRMCKKSSTFAAQ